MTGLWRGMHPFYEQRGAAAVASTFWNPLRAAFAPIQRRPDIFFAGANTLVPSSEEPATSDAGTSLDPRDENQGETWGR